MNRSAATIISPLPLEAHNQPSKDIGEVFPCLGAYEAIDQLRLLLSLEESTYRPPRQYVISHRISDVSDRVSESWRRRICEWIFEVVDHFSFDREVVHVALSYLDRSVSLVTQGSEAPIKKREFQLFAITSLYLAIKIHGEVDGGVGERRFKLGISAFEDLSRGLFKIKDIEATERRILGLLNWRLNPPTTSKYVAHLVRLVPEWSPSCCEATLEFRRIATRLYDVAKYFTELACFTSACTFDAGPSTVAYAALLCAIESEAHAGMRVPEHALGTFVRIVESISEGVWSPNDEGVMRVQRVIRRLAPDMFRLQPLPPPPKMTRVVSLPAVEDANPSIRTVSPSGWDEEARSQEDAPRKKARTT